MKFTMQVSNADGAWGETYDEETVNNFEEAEAFGKELVATYNATLRPHEKPRTFVSVEIVGETTSFKHKWSKQNIYTQSDRFGQFDILKCSECGAKARRYGLYTIKMQKGFTGKKYRTCPRKKEQP